MNETPTRLLEATRRCIATKGLAATTSRDITAAAGANLAAITYHFGSKDRLVADALLETLRARLAPALDALAGEGEPGARMARAVQLLVAAFEEHRDDAPVFLEAFVQAPHLAAVGDGVRGLLADLRGALAADMRRMRRRGELPRWVDPEAMAGVLVAVANGIVVQVVVDADAPPVTAMAAQFAHLLLAARPPA
jgi:AcrR family transcriptional regulator